jgi:hypothetical protein
MRTRPGTGRPAEVPRIRATATAAGRGLAPALVSLPGAVLCLTLSAVSIALIPAGAGTVTTPWVLTGVRPFADRRRLLAARWGGVRIPRAYRPLPPGAAPWARTFGMLRDPATWRDMGWLLVDATAGFTSALLPAALLFHALEGFAIAAGLWRVLTDAGNGTYWYGFVPVTGQATALYAAALAAALLVPGVLLAPRLLHGHFLLTRAELGSRRGEPAERVRVPAETRRDAVGTSAAELRRIERDPHDGARARSTGA